MGESVPGILPEGLATDHTQLLTTQDRMEKRVMKKKRNLYSQAILKRTGRPASSCLAVGY